MVPQTLILRNFMCYREDVPELKLDGIEIACLSGDNGSGKSALLDAITWVLWGRARMSDDELVAMGASEMSVEMRFELSGHDYRVMRSYQRGKKTGKSTLDLQMRNGVGWKTLGEQQIRQTEERIIELLRMKYDTFINSAFLLQGRADEFTRKAPGERKQVLADILDLGEYAQLEARAKERVKELSDRIRVLDGQIEEKRVQASKQAFYVEALAKAEARLTDVSDALDLATGRLRAAEARVRELETRREQRDAALRRVEGLEAEQATQARQAADLQTAITAAEATLARRAEIEAGMEALAAAQADLERLEELRPQYETLENQRQQLKDTLKDALNELKSALKDAQIARDRLRQQSDRRSLLHDEVATLGSQLDALAPLATTHEQHENTLTQLDERINRQKDLQVRRAQLINLIEKRQDSLIATREEKQRLIVRLDRQLAEEPRWQSDLIAARAERERLNEDEQQLVTLRAREHDDAEHVIELRSHCQSIKSQADSLKERQALLTPDQASCPVCGNDLGHDGIERVREHYNVEIQELRASYRTYKQDADGGDKELKQLRAEIDTLGRQIDGRRQATAGIATLENQISQAANLRVEREGVDADLQSVLQQLAAKDFDRHAQSELRMVDADLAALGDLAVLGQQRKSLAAEISALDRQLREQGKLEGMLVTRQGELNSIDRELAALPAAEERAQTLTTTIETNDYAHDVRAQGRALELELKALSYTREAHDGARNAARALSHWEAQERQLATALQQIELNRYKRGELDAAVRRSAELIGETRQQIIVLDEALLALRGADGELRGASAAERQLQEALSVAQRDLGEKEAWLRSAEEAAAQLLERENEQRGLQERKSVFQELEQAYGKKGIQAMLIETAIPEIEREANALLGRMTDNQMHIAVETQKETKKGDAQETLEIKIADALGTRAYDAFSGGESFRVDFAVRIALSKLLARRAGARLETLVIDEGFGALDARGRERLVEAISSVRPDFRRILVITHIQELKDLFPTQIEITKTPEGSRWQIV